jgi:hypothetical protein
MIRIIDSGSMYGNTGFGDTTITIIDRAIYNRLQTAQIIPLGTGPKDNVPPISTFIASMENIQADSNFSDVDKIVDEFFGSLGVSRYYPHPDNTFTEEIK